MTTNDQQKNTIMRKKTRIDKTTNEPRLHDGGLMRCCINTWLAYKNIPAEPGSRILCKCCNNPMRRHENGDWEWDREEALKNEPWFKGKR